MPLSGCDLSRLQIALVTTSHRASVSFRSVALTSEFLRLGRAGAC